MGADRETDVARLAEALQEQAASALSLYVGDELPEATEALVAALMPTVDVIARQRAAEELEAVGREMRVAPTTRVPLGEIADKLDDRAAALRGPHA